MNSQVLTLPPVRPTDNFGNDGTMHKTLDMRPTNVYGNDLAALILESVRATQVLYGINLPDRIILSHKQFVSVEADTQAMDATTDRIYLTPLNVMEVAVDHDYETVDEDVLDVLIGYESADDMGISKADAKEIVLHDN